MDRGAWQATVHGVTKSRIQLSMHTYKHITVKGRTLKTMILNKTIEKTQITLKIIIIRWTAAFPTFYYKIFKHRTKLIELCSEYLYSHYLDSTINTLFNFTIFALSHIFYLPLYLSISPLIAFRCCYFVLFRDFFVCVPFKVNYKYDYTSS